ncbi:MAG TPA: adenosylcobinamide-GDP ribazoletransferase [Cytophagales bacterium]|nr:adenosylcobinamide-GDP ribazoletransferase [Cytophagales bacterium]HAP64008.1 adenosylcobinamide-GDP ribazoletransferase [Cytophagales bacterium]
MKQELRIFFTALMFYTRIPCPSWVDHSPDYINKATRYFPLIGWIVGGVSFAAYFLFSFLFTIQIGVVASLVAGVLVTGAFHEDGLADVYDGFGGGWTKAKILEIMKDSRVGTYGVAALVFLFLTKYLLLTQWITTASEAWLVVLLAFLSYHSLARLTAINMVFTTEYAREDEQSKAKPIAKAHGPREILGAWFFGLAPLAGLAAFHWQYALVILPLPLLLYFSRRYFIKWIGGYTGDCLGAVEQLAECLVLATLFVLWKFM